MRRVFTGARDNPSGMYKSMARELRKIELRKGGKLPLTPTMRYKMIMARKIDEHHKKTGMNAYTSFSLPGAKKSDYKMSKRAEMALKELAKKKATKEAKELRQMVVIKPRWYGNVGYINDKGKVFDQASNLTLKVDPRNGKIKSLSGWTVGKYKPNSGWHDGWMQTWIKKYSPYHIRLQQLELQRQIAAMYGQQNGAVTVHGPMIDPALLAQMVDGHGNRPIMTDAHGNLIAPHGETAHPEITGRTNLGVTAWGVTSNNVWGTYGDNVWGGFAENAWGTTYNNVWGGIGDPGNMWNRPGRRIWGSGRGSQKNYIFLWGRVAASLLGLGGRKQRNRGIVRIGAPRSSQAASRPTGPRGGR